MATATMMLPPSDSEYLTSRSLVHEVASEGGLCVVIRAWQLPQGYDRATADLLIRLPGGYPDAPPDMWWFDPAIRLASGQGIQATEVQESYLGRSWQRWSRHLQGGQWKPGIDGLESYLAIITRDLNRWVPAAGK